MIPAVCYRRASGRFIGRRALSGAAIALLGWAALRLLVLLLVPPAPTRYKPKVRSKCFIVLIAVLARPCLCLTRPLRPILVDALRAYGCSILQVLGDITAHRLAKHNGLDPSWSTLIAIKVRAASMSQAVLITQCGPITHRNRARSS